MLKTPILYIVFNRPDHVKLSFDVIRRERPNRLYLASDGPRSSFQEDERKCIQVREYLLENIDWDCEVFTLFNEENLGCGLAVSRAITWFFENEERGIIIEDDLLVDPTFFQFCEQLLKKYETQKSIFSISAVNWQDEVKRGDYSYFFSKYPGIWGWATWRDRWLKYDYYLNELDQFIASEKIKRITKRREEIIYHIDTFKEAKNVDTWDYQWKFTLFNHSGLCIIPNSNLVRNIGFGVEATHTKEVNSFRANRLTNPVLFPLKHPSKIVSNNQADRYTASRIFMPKSIGRTPRFVEQVRHLASIFMKPFRFNEHQTEGVLEIIEKLRFRFQSKGNHIFVACFPKSGSTFLVNTLGGLLNYKFAMFISSYGRNEHDIYEPKLIDHYGLNTVTHQHCRLTPANLLLLKKYKIKPVILVRNIYDSIISFQDHILKESQLWPMAHIATDFYDKSSEQQVAFLIDFVLPWYFDFYVGWYTALNDKTIDGMMITYEDFMRDKIGTIKGVLNFSGIDSANLSNGQIESYLKSTTGEGKDKSRLNQGISGRGLINFSPSQIDKVKRLTSHYPSVDFSPIGL